MELDLIKTYAKEIELLTEALWKNTATAKSNPFASMPEWFEKIMEKRIEGMLQISIAATHPWVVFPEYVPNYSLVLYKKVDGEMVKKIKRLQMRYFDNLSAPKSDEFAKKATSIFNVRVTKMHNKKVIRLEDEVLLVYSFPTIMLNTVLATLGVPEQSINY